MQIFLTFRWFFHFFSFLSNFLLSECLKSNKFSISHKKNVPCISKTRKLRQTKSLNKKKWRKSKSAIFIQMHHATCNIYPLHKKNNETFLYHISLNSFNLLIILLVLLIHKNYTRIDAWLDLTLLFTLLYFLKNTKIKFANNTNLIHTHIYWLDRTFGCICTLLLFLNFIYYSVYVWNWRRK